MRSGSARKSWVMGTARGWGVMADPFGAFRGESRAAPSSPDSCQPAARRDDSIDVSDVPLRLTLEPLTPTRTPSPHGNFEYIAALRLPNGPLVRTDDPLLAAYGAVVASIDPEDDVESLQGPEFDPGRRVRLERELDVNDEPIMGVWDADGVRRAGHLFDDDPDVATVLAAAEHGLAPEGVVLIEHRSAGEDRRVAGLLFVYSPALVSVELPPGLPVARPSRTTRRRVVLLADRGDVRFWDPSGKSGPMEPQELPISPELATELKKQRKEYRKLARECGGEPGFERLELGWVREQLDERAAGLWRRVRGELGRRYAVGYLGPGMQRPVWSPGELQQAGGPEYLGLSDADIPF